MAAIGETRAQQIKARARELGITDEQFAELLGGYYLPNIGRQQAANLERRIEEYAGARRAAAGLATERQVSYIMTLLQRRRINGDGGGFYAGPTDRAGVERLTKEQASTYIDSLTERY